MKIEKNNENNLLFESNNLLFEGNNLLFEGKSYGNTPVRNKVFSSPRWLLVFLGSEAALELLAFSLGSSLGSSLILWFRAALATLLSSFAFGKGCNTEPLRGNKELPSAVTQIEGCTCCAAPSQFRAAPLRAAAFTGPCWALQGFVGLHWASLGFVGLY